MKVAPTILADSRVLGTGDCNKLLQTFDQVFGARERATVAQTFDQVFGGGVCTTVLQTFDNRAMYLLAAPGTSECDG